MDADRFDTLARALTMAPSRRGVGRALAGLTLAGALGPLLGLAGAEAKKNKKKRTCRNCGGSCRTCRKGTCKAKPDGIVCAGGGKVCLGGECACSPSTEDVAGRCAAPCGDACEATCDVCADTFDGVAEFCGRLFVGSCSDLLPCANHGGCATNELCVMTGCPAVNGVTNKCRVLC